LVLVGFYQHAVAKKIAVGANTGISVIRNGEFSWDELGLSLAAAVA
jgi:hypothetical protein